MGNIQISLFLYSMFFYSISSGNFSAEQIVQYATQWPPLLEISLNSFFDSLTFVCIHIYGDNDCDDAD